MSSQTSQIILTTSRGLDELLQSEVKQIIGDASTKIKPGQVILEGTLKDAYKLCLHSRLANRVLWVVAQGFADNAEQLYQTTYEVDWPKHLSSAHRFVVNFNGTNRAIKNSQFGAQRVKDAIVDRFTDQNLVRPTVDKINANVFVQARLWRDKVIIGIDLSGKSLHQRGYRSEAGEAPLKEHVAAALLMRSGWAANKDQPLLDPMCGSATIAIEAAQMAANIPPGLERQQWGFSDWKQHDQSMWEEVLNAAKENIKPSETLIFANDNDPRVINIAKRNANLAGVFEAIQFTQQDALKNIPKEGIGQGYIVSNPPYGERLSDIASLVPFFFDYGNHLKQSFKGWNVSLLTSQRDLFRQLKLRSKKEYALMNGKLECKLVNYQLDESNLEIRSGSDSSEFANRLKKNIKQLQKFLKKTNTNAYRIYDADLPEYNVAIDVYADWLVVQEYAPPKNIPAEKAQRRLTDIIIQLPAVTGFSADKIALKTRSQQKGKAQYQKVAENKENIVVHEHGAKFYVNPTDYLDCGLFLDHRITRQLAASKSKNKDVLNLFAYTGSVSVHCALHCARSVTTVDLSNTYIQWAKRNFSLNRISGKHEFQQADCVNWFDQHDKMFDLMFIDPPSFSNSKRMENTWDVQRDHLALLAKAYTHLNKGGEVIFSNNLRQFKLDYSGLESIGFSILDVTQKTIPEDFKRNPKIHHCWVLTK
jgi:23S rRNA (guanine2445-N2)-methyltransferase / 23S rRNA (guanine2069-N7)-methyltransferase